MCVCVCKVKTESVCEVRFMCVSEHSKDLFYTHFLLLFFQYLNVYVEAEEFHCNMLDKIIKSVCVCV